MMVKGGIKATSAGSGKTVILDRKQSSTLAQKYGDAVAKAVQKAAEKGGVVNKTALVALLTTKGSKLNVSQAQKEAERIIGSAKSKAVSAVKGLSGADKVIKAAASGNKAALGKVANPFGNKSSKMFASALAPEKTPTTLAKEPAKVASTRMAPASAAQQSQIQREDLRRSMEDPKWGNSKEREVFLKAGAYATTAQKALVLADKERSAKDPKWKTSPERLALLKGSVETDKDTAGNMNLAGKMMEEGVGKVNNPLKSKASAMEESAQTLAKEKQQEPEPEKVAEKAQPQEKAVTPEKTQPQEKPQEKQEQPQEKAPAPEKEPAKPAEGKSFKRLLFEAFLPRTAKEWYGIQDRKAAEKAKAEQEKAAVEAQKKAEAQAKEKAAEKEAAQQAKEAEKLKREEEKVKREEAAEARRVAAEERRIERDKRAEEREAKREEREKAKDKEREERAKIRAEKEAAKAAKAKKTEDMGEEVRTPNGELLGHLQKDGNIRLVDGTIVPA